MEVSAPASRPRVPGFSDRLGERLTVAQRSGAELEYLNFCLPLALAPFFAPGLKTRVARLSRFSHGSYCRVRRVEHTADLDHPIALVSMHVPGRRLAELLDVAARAGLTPPTSAVLALARQTMTAVALLHDFAPDGFHGALGPERLILAGDLRVVIAEHVLGTAVGQAAQAWGPARLWQDYRLAVLPDTGTAHCGRRNDVVQVGLIVLALLLGRPLDDAAFPGGLAALLDEVAERRPDATVGPVHQALRNWLERTLALAGEASFDTLLESQKALDLLIQDGHHAASPAAWEAFVRSLETAALRVPLVVVVPEPAPAGAAPAEAASTGTPAQPGERGETGVTTAAPVEADPFGPWPVAVPAESASALFDAYLARAPEAEPPPRVKTPAPADPSPDPWALQKASPIHPEPLFETLWIEPAPAAPTETCPPAGTRRDRHRASAIEPTTVADWHPPEPAGSPAPVWLHPGHPDQRLAATGSGVRFGSAGDRRRRVRLAVLALLAAVATAGAVYAPAIWAVANETFRTYGTVTVESNPPGALITVDGQMRGHAPADLRLQPGEHLVEVQAGGSARSRTITVAPRAKTTEAFTLPEAGERGGFRITTYPASGRISIDGKYRGDAPVKVTDLTPGTHTLVVETRLGTQEQDIVVQPGQVLQLAVPTASWIKVNAPYDLAVYEDGRLLGTTGKEPVLVRPGRHHLDFINQELGLKLRQLVDAVPGQVVTVPLDLPTGMINLFSDHPAEVLVDGEKVGNTPLSSVQVPLGSHEVVVRHPQYGEVRYTVRVTLAAPVQLRVTFRK